MADATNETYVPGTATTIPSTTRDIRRTSRLEQKRRWDTCEEPAELMFGDLDSGEARAQIWSAIRVFYNSDSPTGDESERI